MAIASDLSAESQHKPAPVDATSEASVSIEQQQMTSTPGTGELLDRVVTEFSQAFQSSLVQVVSDIRRDYGVDVEPGSKFAWMEKGGAAIAPGDEQLPRNDDDDGDSNDVHRILRELQLSRLQLRQLQQVVDGLREEQRLSKQRVALFGTLSAKLKRDLVDERLALIDAKNEIKELQQRRSRNDTGLGGGGGRSPQSPLLQEHSDNLWNSPNKSIAGSADGVSRPGTTDDGPEGPNLMGFNFYPSRGAGGQDGANDDDSPSTSSSTQTLRSTLIGQFLPSALLDSPQFTPKHARPFAIDTLNEEKVSPLMFQLKDAALPTCSTVNQQYTYDGTGDETKETSQGDSGRVSTLSAVSPLKVSMLSELFDAIPIEELEMILRRCDGLESAAIDNILSSHPSFNPAVGAGERVESDASMALPSPSRSSSVGHSKTNLHRSSQSGPSGPPSGSSSNRKTEICMYYMQGKCNKTRRTCSFAHGESDLVRPSGSSLGGSISKHGPTYKTRLCQSYENGTCTKPRRECTMAHGVNDLRDGASASGVGGSQPILPPAAPRLQSYKTELCYYFLKGNCNYSREECRFAHGQNDLRTVESNTAQIAAAFSSSGFGGDFGPTSPAPPPPAVSMEKQLQLQHQYQQQYQQHHQPSSMTSFQSQPPPPAQRQSFVPQHQIQLQHSSRGAGGAGHHQFGFQPQQYDLAQQQQQYMPPPSQYRHLRNMEDKRPTSVGRPPRRDSGSSWSSFDATGLPPSEY